MQFCRFSQHLGEPNSISPEPAPVVPVPYETNRVPPEEETNRISNINQLSGFLWRKAAVSSR
jgi:hypothetical protein